jgi:hypothetical protein
MRLTVEENREAIKRYGHIKPARGWGKRPCATKLRGTRRSCTLAKGHTGAHVAHGAFSRVVAVWDESPVTRSTEVRAKGSASALSRQDLGKDGLVQAVKDLAGRVVRHPEHFLEEAAFLVFFLAMVVFVIDWALRILGLR